MSLELSKHNQVTGHREQMQNESFRRQKSDLSRRCVGAQARVAALEVSVFSRSFFVILFLPLPAGQAQAHSHHAPHARTDGQLSRAVKAIAFSCLRRPFKVILPESSRWMDAKEFVARRRICNMYTRRLCTALERWNRARRFSDRCGWRAFRRRTKRSMSRNQRTFKTLAWAGSSMVYASFQRVSGTLIPHQPRLA